MRSYKCVAAAAGAAKHGAVVKQCVRQAACNKTHTILARLHCSLWHFLTVVSVVYLLLTVSKIKCTICIHVYNINNCMYFVMHMRVRNKIVQKYKNQ